MLGPEPDQPSLSAALKDGLRSIFTAAEHMDGSSTASDDQPQAGRHNSSMRFASSDRLVSLSLEAREAPDQVSVRIQPTSEGSRTESDAEVVAEYVRVDLAPLLSVEVQDALEASEAPSATFDMRPREGGPESSQKLIAVNLDVLIGPPGAFGPSKVVHR